MTNRFALGLVLAPLVVLGACSQEAETSDDTLVIYSSRHYDSDYALYEAFTEATGVEVEVVEADGDLLIERVKADGDSNPPDVIITVDSGRLWKADQEGLSKYQIALELKVAEKIKMGLTGDKEWRALMIKQSNKLIQAAVLKNPRITDGEVLTIANNKSSSEDLIRMILLNKEWMKLYEIKKALITHPKTPPPKAMRLVPMLTMKDIKELAKSRQVSTLVSTAARKELELRIKKTGG